VLRFFFKVSLTFAASSWKLDCTRSFVKKRAPRLNARAAMQEHTTELQLNSEAHKAL